MGPSGLRKVTERTGPFNGKKRKKSKSPWQKKTSPARIGPDLVVKKKKLDTAQRGRKKGENIGGGVKSDLVVTPSTTTFVSHRESAGGKKARKSAG